MPVTTHAIRERSAVDKHENRGRKSKQQQKASDHSGNHY
jgi:hypothetical protein